MRAHAAATFVLACRCSPASLPRGASAAGSRTAAQEGPQRYSSNEILDTGHRFFGGVSRGLAQVVERAFSTWGQPNGYVLGQEGGGAFVAGLRYGEGTLYTKNAGDLRVFWQGPSLGWDVGGEGARTMMLIYNLPATRGDLPAFRRRRRLGLFRRRRRHDGADRQRHRGGADPLGRGPAAWRQCRLPEIHAAGDLESVLSRMIPKAGHAFEITLGNPSSPDRCAV